MKVLVAGGAGFIGSHLIDKLIEEGKSVVCADKLVFSSIKNIEHLFGNDLFTFVEMDLSNKKNVDELFEKYQIEMVYHLAANSDIQKGATMPDIDFNDTFITTRCILESMRKYNVKKLFFSSTSAVYGEMCDEALNEVTGGLKPVSYYGGAKLASEAFVASYAAMNDMSCVVFRFPNVIGPRLTHGVIYDFIEKLKKNPDELEILGDGSQCKPYIYVHDLVSAIIMLTKKIMPGIELYNVGVKDSTTVTRIAEIVRDKMELPNAKFIYTGGDRGWKGDVPRFEYDINKIESTGWRAEYTSDESVIKTIEEALKW